MLKNNFFIKSLIDYFFIELYVIFVCLLSFILSPDRWFLTSISILLISCIVTFFMAKKKNQ